MVGFYSGWFSEIWLNLVFWSCFVAAWFGVCLVERFGFGRLCDFDAFVVLDGGFIVWIAIRRILCEFGFPADFLVWWDFLGFG